MNSTSQSPSNAGKCVSHDTHLVQRLEFAYDKLNNALFDGKLPLVVITLHRQRNVGGYFWTNRYVNRENKQDKAHELAINPDYLDRSVVEVLSTLAHEMAHVWQQELGTPPRKSYHDHQWASEMLRIGLKPMNVKNPNRMTGQNCTHEIVKGGLFEDVADWMVKAGFSLDYVGEVNLVAKALSQAKRKTKYACPQCGAAAWGKPQMNIVCGDCQCAMESR